MNTVKQWLYQGKATAIVCAKQKLDAGPLKSMAGDIVTLCEYIVLVLLWRSLARAGVDLHGLTEQSLLTYTLISFACRPMLNILSPATSCLWEGSIIGRYSRPMPVYLSFISETVGRWWIPRLAFFTLPLVAASALLGISPLPASPAAGLLFIPSLLLSVVVGFGIDILFASIAIRMKNSMWMATAIREAVYNLLSGALIPFALLPGGVAVILGLLPFGSIASAPLSIYIGAAKPAPLLALQAFWAVVIWIIAHRSYKNAEWRMVSYGG